VVFSCPYCALSAGLNLWICGGTNVAGNRCERKYSLHSNEVSLSTMRLGRGREGAVKKARMKAKDDTQSEAYCNVLDLSQPIPTNVP
jgi:hypothetical protein